MPEFYRVQNTPYGYNKSLNKWLTHDAVKQVIYPRWDASTFTNGKGSSPDYLVHSPRDNWLWNSNLKESKTMETIIAQTTQKLGAYWKNPGNGQGLYKGHMQKHYLT